MDIEIPITLKILRTQALSFNDGVIIACRCDIDSQPSRNDLLHISVMYGVSSEWNCMSMDVGIGSRQPSISAL